MATSPREWPNVAKDARDRAAELAQEGLHAMEPLLDGQAMTESDRIRREAVGIKCFGKIVRLLESVGAQTRP